MGATLRVQVPPKGDHLNRSESQLRKGDRPWGGSEERNHEPMNKKPMRGGAEQGERAGNREALMVNAQASYIGRLRGEGSGSYLGRSRLGSERVTS
jgi:hypothetical protein